MTSIAYSRVDGTLPEVVVWLGSSMVYEHCSPAMVPYLAKPEPLPPPGQCLFTRSPIKLLRYMQQDKPFKTGMQPSVADRKA